MGVRFFCDHCGEEIPLKASRCSRCGRIFTAVECPQCGFSAQAETFLKGCPACGYAGALEEEPRKRRGSRWTYKGGGAALPRPSGSRPPDVKPLFSPAFFRAASLVLGILILSLLVFLLSR